MLRRVYRQRRRLIAGFVLITAVIFVSLAPYQDVLFGHREAPRWMISLALFLASLGAGLVYLGLGIFVVILLPAWRSLVEIIPLCSLVGAFGGVLFPDHLAIMSTSTWGPLLSFVLFMATWHFVYGTGLDRFRFILGYSAKRSFRSPRTAEDLWPEHIIGAASVGKYWDKLLCELEVDPDDPGSFEVTYNHGSSLFQRETITVLEESPCKNVRHYFLGDVNPANRSMTEGTWSVTFSPLEKGPGTRVTIEMHRPSMLPRLALQSWMDDEVGDICDHLSARETRRRDWSMKGRYVAEVGKYA